MLQVTHRNWALIFDLSAGLLVLGATTFACLARATEQDFDAPDAGQRCCGAPSSPRALRAKLLDADLVVAPLENAPRVEREEEQGPSSSPRDAAA